MVFAHDGSEAGGAAELKLLAVKRLSNFAQTPHRFAGPSRPPVILAKAAIFDRRSKTLAPADLKAVQRAYAYRCPIRRAQMGRGACDPVPIKNNRHNNKEACILFR